MSQHIIRKKPLVPSLPERLSGAEVENWKVYCFDDYTGPPVRSGRGPEGTRESAVEFNTFSINQKINEFSINQKAVVAGTQNRLLQKCLQISFVLSNVCTLFECCDSGWKSKIYMHVLSIRHFEF